MESLRQIRRRAEAGGVEALLHRPHRGGQRKVTPRIRRDIFRAFDAGQRVCDVRALVLRDKKRWGGIGKWTVSRLRRQWLALQERVPATEPDAAPLDLPLAESPWAEPVAQPDPAPLSVPHGAEEGGQASPQQVAQEAQAACISGGPHIQHVGAWLLLSMVHALGLHDAVQQGWDAAGRQRKRLRVALDAVVLALGLGERCVEGVRRLRTCSGSVLLRADGVPTANFTRRVLGHYLGDDDQAMVNGPVSGRGQRAQQRMMAVYLQRARKDAQEPAVFYVDNHMRPYTGKFTLRKGWRMQDKRARPGASDYYVHDEDGRPVFRFTAPQHDSLSRWLSPVTRTLRDALGRQQQILLTFPGWTLPVVVMMTRMRSSERAGTCRLS